MWSATKRKPYAWIYGTALPILAIVLLTSIPVDAEGCGPRAIVAGVVAAATDTAELVLGGSSSCSDGENKSITYYPPQPYYTYEVTCSPNPANRLDGLCSTTPCTNRLAFALRTIHNPDGTQAAAGFACVSLNQAAVVPGITAAEVFAAVRRVKLPGGAIRATPGARGLANLRSFFFLEGAAQPPVDLTVRGSTVRARFEVVEYRWSFGDGQALVTAGPGTPGQDSEVHAIYRRRGRYAVSVEVAWRAEAFLGGNRVGEVDGLASSSQVAYPVAELQTVLTG
jgi:hypothetical protein